MSTARSQPFACRFSGPSFCVDVESVTGPIEKSCCEAARAARVKGISEAARGTGAPAPPWAAVAGVEPWPMTAVEARTVEDGKLALFAQIEPLPDLVAMTKAKQKIYTSIEVTPKFADTGEAYLTGLAVTDSPASLGTEILAFAAQKPEANPFTARKSHAEALFSEAIEATLEFEDAPPEDPGLVAKFVASVKSVSELFAGKAKGDDARFAALLDALQQAGTAVAGQAEKHATLQAAHDKLATAFTTLQTQHTELVGKLSATPEQQHSQRPPATGNSGRIQTDC